MECPSCDLCGRSDPETLYAGESWQRPLPPVALVRCRHCGLMYLSPRPTPDEIGEYYPVDYAPFRTAIEDERFPLMRYMRRRKLVLRRRLVEHFSRQRWGRILDVGCATGLFLHEMNLAGWETAGIELTPTAAEYARTRFGLNVMTGVLADFPPDPATFDAITFWDVLEHTFSPSTELARVATLLKPGGLVAINVPNWHSLDRRLFGPHWIGLDPPRHLYVFTRQSLTALLERSGLRPVAWLCFMPAYFSFAISIERWLEARTPKIGRLVGRTLNFPGVRLLFEPWFSLANALRLGGIIAVFAVKQ